MGEPRPGPAYVLVRERVDGLWFFHAVYWNGKVGPVDNEGHLDESHAVRGARDAWPGYEVRVRYPGPDTHDTIIVPQHHTSVYKDRQASGRTDNP